MVKLKSARRVGCTLPQPQVVPIGWAAPSCRSLHSALTKNNKQINRPVIFIQTLKADLSYINSLASDSATLPYFVFMPKYCDKIRVSTLIARNKIVESHVTVILTVVGSSLPTFLKLPAMVGHFIGNKIQRVYRRLFYHNMPNFEKVIDIIIHFRFIAIICGK